MNFWETKICIISGLIYFFFQAVQISQASPAWQDYIDYVDAIVLDGLKQATLTSLKSMLNNLVQANMSAEVRVFNTQAPGHQRKGIIHFR